MSPLQRNVCGISQLHSRFRLAVMLGHFHSAGFVLTITVILSIFLFLASGFLYSLGTVGLRECKLELGMRVLLIDPSDCASTTLAESSSPTIMGSTNNSPLVKFVCMLGSIASAMFEAEPSGNVESSVDAFSRCRSGNVVFDSTHSDRGYMTSNTLKRCNLNGHKKIIELQSVSTGFAYPYLVNIYLLYPWTRPREVSICLRWLMHVEMLEKHVQFVAAFRRYEQCTRVMRSAQ